LKFPKIATNAKNYDVVSRTFHVPTIGFSLQMRRKLHHPLTDVHVY